MNKRLKALEKRVRKVEEWLTSRDASADGVSAAPSALHTAGEVTVQAVGVRNTGTLLPRGISLSFDDAKAALTIEGIVYGYEFFRQLGGSLPVGSHFQVAMRQDGVVGLRYSDPPPTDRDLQLTKLGRRAFVGWWWWSQDKGKTVEAAQVGTCLACLRKVPTPWDGGSAAEHHSIDCPVPERP